MYKNSKEASKYLFDKGMHLEALLVVREALNEKLGHLLLQNRKASEEQIKILMAVKYIFKVRIAYGTGLIDEKTYSKLKEINSMRDNFVGLQNKDEKFAEEVIRVIKDGIHILDSNFNKT